MRTLKEVLSYTNQRIVRKFRVVFAVDEAEAERIFVELKKFLWLSALRRAEHRDGIPGVPNMLTVHVSMVIMDEMWHIFILHTQEYIEFCNQYLDEYVHHSPGRFDFVPPTVEQTEMQLAYIWERLGEETVLLWYDTYEQQYSPDNMLRLLKPIVFGRPCEDV